MQIILGVDPGSLFMGYSIIQVNGQQQLTLREMDVLKLSRKKDNYERLQLIHERITELAVQYRPTSFAIEAPFFGKNVQSMLKLGRAQGVAIAAAMTQGMPVTEYSPKKVKQSITGNGNADKEQVWQMLERILSLNGRPQYFDATDALAVAVCHYHQSKLIALGAAPAKPLPKSKKSSWEAFADANQHRIV